jgi:predicted NBD/HSP70 family sugar kinase
MARQPAAQASLRDRTKDDVYELIRASGAATRSSIAEATGYSPSTVGHAVAKLLAEGRIIESDQAPREPGSGAGRPAKTLHVVSTQALTGAIDFGQSHVGVAVGTNRGELLKEVRRPFEVGERAEEAMAMACRMLQELAAEHSKGRLALVVAGVPAPIDFITGNVCAPTLLPGWTGRAPAKELEDRLAVRVVVENDAFLGACGELQHGAGRLHRDFIYVRASHGIGAAIVLDGRARKGATGLSGEIGHTRIDGRDDPCRCGKFGCLEAVASLDIARRRIADVSSGTARKDLAEVPDADEVFRECGSLLGTVLADVCNALNPSAVVLGGELGQSGQAYIEGVRASIDQFALPAIAAAVEITAAEFGDRAEIRGALTRASQRLTA